MFIPDKLRDKALLALEDAVQECRYRTPRRSFAVRFALAYLWAYDGRANRAPFEALWRALGAPKSPWSFNCADSDLLLIYRRLGIERDEKVSREMWQRWSDQEGCGGR